MKSACEMFGRLVPSWGELGINRLPPARVFLRLWREINAEFLSNISARWNIGLGIAGCSCGSRRGIPIQPRQLVSRAKPFARICSREPGFECLFAEVTRRDAVHFRQAERVACAA